MEGRQALSGVVGVGWTTLATDATIDLMGTELVTHYNDFINRLRDLMRRVDKNPLLIGVDGQGGSGKSTLAREVVRRLGCSAVVVEGDDFYREMPDEERVVLTAEQGFEQYFDWRRLRREVLESVARADDVLRYQRYNWDRATMGEWVELPMPGVVIVEGVYTLRPQLRDLVDVKVYVNASKEVRTQRQIDRGQDSNEWIRRWIAAEDFYVATWEPRAVADLVVEGG